MKNLLTLTAISASVFFTAPAHSAEVSADKIKAIQLYTGNAKIIFDPSEKFEIHAEKNSAINNISFFSGSVAVTFRDSKVRADAVSLKVEPDGSSILEAENFTLENTRIK